jgi:transcriptional regulator with XRE-family HTH domain
MLINKLLEQKNITIYRLAKTSGVPYTTVNDICGGKAKNEKCAAETLYKLANTLDVTMEALIADSVDSRPDFEIFKSHICHRVKDMGDLDFIINMLQTDEIRKYYQKQWYLESLYLLAMVDYLSRENGVPLCTKYNDLRNARLQEVIYPAGVHVRCTASGSEKPKQESIADSIPEFMRHNIVEAEVRNVY